MNQRYEYIRRSRPRQHYVIYCLVCLVLSCASGQQGQIANGVDEELDGDNVNVNQEFQQQNPEEDELADESEEADPFDESSQGQVDNSIDESANANVSNNAEPESDLLVDAQEIEENSAQTSNIAIVEAVVPVEKNSANVTQSVIAPQVEKSAEPSKDAGLIFPQLPTPVEAIMTTKDSADIPTFDLMPNRSLLWWIGYDFSPDKDVVRIELVTRGAPRYDLFQERNQAGQPELVVRFYETAIRPKIRRNIDASEFRSPVAFIRMREDKTDESTDVILTLRDLSKPRVYAHNGNILLSFVIPEKYKGKNRIESAASTPAEVLTASDIRPTLIGGSDYPKSFRYPSPPNPSDGVFVSAPADGGMLTEPAFQQAADTNSVSNLTADSLDASLQAANDSEEDQSLPNDNTAGPSGDNTPINNNSQQPGQSQPQENIEQDSDGGNDSGDNQSEPNQDEGEPEDNQNVQGSNFDVDEGAKGYTSVNSISKGEYIVSSFGFAQVAQDTNQEQLDEDFENESEAGGNTENSDQGSVDESSTAGGNGTGINNFPANQVNEELLDVDTSNLNSNLGNGNTGSVDNAADQAQAVPVQNAAPATSPTPDNGQSITPITQGQGGAISGQETLGQDSASDPVKDQGSRPVKLEFRGAKLKEVIRALGEENNINFTFPASIGEELIFMNFKDVQWNDALRAVLETNGLGMVKLDGGVVRIDTLAKLTAEKDDLFRIRESASRLMPTKVLVIRLSYAQADDVKKLIDEMLTSAKSDKRVRVETDKRTNSIVIEATAVDLAKAKALVDRIDLQTPQVQIASRIVEVLRSGANLFGIDWAGPLMGDQGRGLGFGNLVFPNSLLSTFAVDTGATSNAQTQTGINAHIGSINNSVELDLRLRLEESRGTTHILQNNNLIVEDNGKATIQAGRQDFFSITTAQGTPGFTTVDYLLQLEVTPHITADGAVQMNLKIESSSPAAKVSADAESSRSQRLLQTSLLKNSGETAAIGGLYTTEKKDEVFGIPILSDLPIIGALFRTKKQGDDRRELIILVTPTILNGSKGSGSAADMSATAASNIPLGGQEGGLPENNSTGNFVENQGNVSNQSGNNQQVNQASDSEEQQSQQQQQQPQQQQQQPQQQQEDISDNQFLQEGNQGIQQEQQQQGE